MYKVTDEVKELMTIIHNANYECYLVGGAVRDLILGIDNKDFDLCTNMPLDELKLLIPSISIMKENNHRNTAIIRNKEYDYEISSYRGNSIEEDLSNRDFKINALALDIDGNLIDPYNGLDDIKNKKISLIKDDAFIRDPLRILRAIRIANKYNFDIDDNTLQQMDKYKDLLDEVAKERIYEELKKILVFNNISDILLKHKNIFFKIIPNLEKCDGFNQYNDYHIYDVFNHILEVIRNTSNNLELRLATLFHDLGKPDKFFKDEKGVGHFYGHALVSADIFKSFANTYKIDNKTKNNVYKLIKYHDDMLSSKPNKIYNFYKEFGYENIDLLFELKRADALGQNPKYLNRLEEYDTLYKEYIRVKDIITNIDYDGSKLVELGISGKDIGNILDDVTSMIVCGNLENNSTNITLYVKNKYLK